jgi:Cu(I)/Ag(I) efflux system periplasmic protein CusF
MGRLRLSDARRGNCLKEYEMKKKIPVLAITLSLAMASYVWAQSLTDGLVTKVDASAEKITIKHGPMKKFDMDESMTMVYRAKDPAMLQAVKAGDKVKFDAENVNGQFVLTKIQKER